MTPCCPACRGELDLSEAGAACRACGRRFPRVGPVLDLRLPGPSWIDQDEDRNRAERLLSLGADVPARLLLETVFRSRREWTEAQTARRTEQVLAGVARARAELGGWLRPCVARGGPVLDLGCGAGQMLAALAAEGVEAVGVDVSVEWLVVAHRLCREAAPTASGPALIAALAESLPFADGTVGGVISLDVIEHVGDQRAYLRELDRVLVPGGYAAFTTPNRYSAAAEPHVGVWGVGWLPRAWQKRYVGWRSRLPYEYVRLLSARELGALFDRETRLEVRIVPPPLPDDELSRMRGRRALLGRLYNRLVKVEALGPAFRAVGPFFRVLGHKRGHDQRGPAAAGGRAER